MLKELGLGNFSKDHRRYGNIVNKPVGRLDEALLHEIQATQAPAQKYNYKDGQYCLEDICHEIDPAFK
jgi:hypothetical protein